MTNFGRTLALRPDGDIKIGPLNNPEEIEGIPAESQKLRVTLATFRGEDIFDEEHGLDVFAAAGATDDELRAAIIDAIGPDVFDSVEEIDSIDITHTGSRQALVEVTVDFVNGATDTIVVGAP